MQEGKTGFQPIVAFCSVLDATKGIRRDITVYDRPDIKKRADMLLLSAQSTTADEHTMFGAMQAALLSFVLDEPDKVDLIMSAALAIFNLKKDHYFIIHGHHQEGGLTTNYEALAVSNPVDAKEAVDNHSVSRIVEFMKLMREMQGHVV